MFLPNAAMGLLTLQCKARANYNDLRYRVAPRVIFFWVSVNWVSFFALYSARELTSESRSAFETPIGMLLPPTCPLRRRVFTY